MAQGKYAQPGKPPKFKSVAELEEKIQKYFDECNQQGRPLTMSGLAVALDCDRKTIVNYSNKEEYFPTIKRARAIIERSLEEKLVSSNGVVAGIIFSAKNNFGWVDKQEIDQKTNLNGDIQLKWKD